MSILLSEVDSSCWIPLDIKYHENTGDVSPVTEHTKTTELASSRDTTCGDIEILLPVSVNQN